MKCDSTFQTWTDKAEGNEGRPINCLDWFTAFAFCAWDGGRLATDAEWNYAASGGSEQRYYPWSNPASSTTLSPSHASYYVETLPEQCMGDGVEGCSLADLVVVGSLPAGNARWGHADLSGNVMEWALDWDGTYVSPCNNCANLTDAFNRVLGGGSFLSPVQYLPSAARISNNPDNFAIGLGGRCARNNP